MEPKPRGGRRLVIVAAVIAVVVLVFSVVALGLAVLGLINGASRVDGAAGRCVDLGISVRCDHVPMKTFQYATGLSFPRGTEVADSSSAGWGFFHELTAHGTLVIPAGKPSPLKVRTDPSGTTAFTPTAQPAAKLKEKQLRNAAASQLVAVDFDNPGIASGWIVEGLRTDGTTVLYIELDTSDNWTQNAPIVPVPRPTSTSTPAVN